MIRHLRTRLSLLRETAAMALETTRIPRRNRSTSEGIATPTIDWSAAATLVRGPVILDVSEHRPRELATRAGSDNR